MRRPLLRSLLLLSLALVQLTCLPKRETQAPPEAEPEPFLAGVAVQTERTTVNRVKLTPGQEIAQPGLYFLNLASGAIEGWTLPEIGQIPTPSPDNRWVIAHDGTTYLVDRQSGAAYSWPGDTYWLRAAQGDYWLLGANEKLLLVNASERKVTPLPFPSSATQGLFSPDGRRLALLASDGLYLLQTETGRTDLIDQPDRAGAEEVLLATARHGQEFTVEVRRQGGWETIRYGWDGAPRGALKAPGSARPSPDGTLLYWEEPLYGVTGSLLIAIAETGTPRIRLLGASLCFEPLGLVQDTWLPDSAGLVAGTASGYRILTPAGDLLPMPPGLTPGEELLPAPGLPDRFAAGRTRVIDQNGKVLHQLQIGEGLYPGALAPWGQDHREMRIGVVNYGRGPRCAEVAAKPSIEHAPFTSAPALSVIAVEGIPLRSKPDPAGEVVTILPNGARLTVIAHEGPYTGEAAMLSPYVAWDYGTHSTWFRVRAAAGEEGWAEADSLQWLP